MSRYSFRVSVSKYVDILCLHPLRAYQCQGVTCDPGQLSSSLETAALGAGAGEAGDKLEMDQRHPLQLGDILKEKKISMPIMLI